MLKSQFEEERYLFVEQLYGMKRFMFLRDDIVLSYSPTKDEFSWKLECRDMRLIMIELMIKSDISRWLRFSVGSGNSPKGG